MTPPSLRRVLAGPATPVGLLPAKAQVFAEVGAWTRRARTYDRNRPSEGEVTTRGNSDHGKTNRLRGGNGRFARSLKTAKTDAEACRLRSSGLTYHQIAQELGHSGPGKAHDAVKRALHAVVEEPATHLRTLELMRLDLLQLAIWPKAIAGDVHMIDRVVKIIARRCKLLGLDAPQMVEVISPALLDQEIRKLERELGRSGPVRDAGGSHQLGD